MEAIVVLITLYVLLYVWYIGKLFVGYGNVATFVSDAPSPGDGFTIVIPFRNEESHLPALLASFGKLDYPRDRMELIFIDDLSTDRSAAIINRWRLDHPEYHTTMIDNVRMSASPKKDAIARSIPIALHPWIVTTDADCTVPHKWLLTLHDFIARRNVRMVCGPVKFRKSSLPLALFQQTDLLALQAATMGGFGLRDPFMCNAANFAFHKSFFNELGGFAGVSHASGDDVFLLQKAWARHPEQVGYLKSAEAVVTTVPPSTVGGLIMQRVRWASKAKSYVSALGETVSLAVFFGNFALLIGMAMTLWGAVSWEIGLAWFGVKFTADYALALRANGFLKQRRFFFPLLGGLVYPAFSTIVGLMALPGRYTWKGRTLR